MSNLRIGYINLADSATLTADPVVEAADPVTYLQNDNRGYMMQSTGLTAQQIKGEWGGTAYTISMCALYRHNLVTNDSWRLQLYSDVAWTTQVYDSGTIDAFTDNIFDNWDFGFSTLWFTPTASVKSFKLTLTSSANPDGYITASRLFIGAYTEANYNPNYGMNLGYETSSTQVRADSGSLHVNSKAKWRKMTFDLMVTSETDRALWLEIGRYCGVEKTVFVSVYPGDASATLERDHSIMGKFDKSPAQISSSFGTYDHQITLLEI
jgi:hypothetical protein